MSIPYVVIAIAAAAAVLLLLLLLLPRLSCKDPEQFAGDEFAALQSQLAAGKPVVVMFYASWCGACKAFKPVYDEAAASMGGQGVTLLKVDHDKHQGAIDAVYPGVSRTIEFYPTVMALRPSGSGEPVIAAVYAGDRTVADLSAFAKQHA